MSVPLSAAGLGAGGIGAVGAAVAGAAGLGAAALACGALIPNCPLFGPVVGRGPRAGRALYLTFDDGPSPSATPAVLEALGEAGVPAAFFLLGRHVERFPELARRVASAGHEVANHTHHHRKLHLQGPGAIRRDLEAAHLAITSATGRVPVAFRAPHGYRSPFVGGVARRLGYTVFGWTFGVWDSDRPGAEEIRRRVRARLTPGAIILLHDGDGYDPAGDRGQTAVALPGILRDATAAGYGFRPLADLLPPAGRR